MGEQALLMIAHLRKGETYVDLVAGFQVGPTTVYRYAREALDVLAALAPTLIQAMQVLAAPAGRLSGLTRTAGPRQDAGAARDHVDAAHRSRPRPYDKELTDLVGELSTRSDAFRVRWGAHDVRLHRTGQKHIHHPVVGELHLSTRSWTYPPTPAWPWSPTAPTPAPPPTTPYGSLPAGLPPTSQPTPWRRRTKHNSAALPTRPARPSAAEPTRSTPFRDGRPAQ